MQEKRAIERRELGFLGGNRRAFGCGRSRDRDRDREAESVGQQNVYIHHQQNAAV